MSLDEIAKLQAEEAELIAKLEAAKEKRFALEKVERERKAQAEAEALLKKHIVVSVDRITGGNLIIVSDYRPDLTELWRTIPGRSFRGDRENLIPMSEWEATQQKILSLPFTEIAWKEGVKEQMAWMLSAPPYEVTYNEKKKEFVIILGPSASYVSWYEIPGHRYEYNSRNTYDYHIPFAEGWRIPEVLKNIEGVVYSNEAQAIILQQIARRGELDQIAIKEDTDFDKINMLTRIIWNKRKRVYEPFKDVIAPHQKVMVEFMYVAEGNMINGDDTGVGKTMSAFAYAEIRRQEIEAKGEKFQAIVCVKATLIPQFREEIENLTGAPPYQCFTGTPNEYDTMKIMFEKVPYVLISYDTLASYRVLRDGEEINIKAKEIDRGDQIQYPWVELFNLAEPTLLIGDEAHYVKNTSAHKTKAILQLARPPHTLLLTATPILNRADELAVPLRLVAPGLFPSTEEFRRNYTIDGKIATNVERLQKMMRPFFLRRRKQDVMANFPQINRIKQLHDLSSESLDAYNEILSGFYTELKEFDPKNIGGNRMAVEHHFATIIRLAQVCAADSARSFTPELALEISDAANGEAGKKKVLIFSRFKGTAYNIARSLGAEALCTVTPDNTADKFSSMDVHNRNALFDEARKRDDIKFVVTTEASKEGHNLEYCWWTIFNDPWWSPLAHYQGEGRCIRFDSPHSIDSFYVVANTEIMQWWYDLLDTKLSLHDSLVEGTESNRDFAGSVAAALLDKIKESMWNK